MLRSSVAPSSHNVSETCDTLLNLHSQPIWSGSQVGTGVFKAPAV